ncbi:MAG: VWA domain-containing protein [Thermodesulfobacteriota bacterium]
MTRLSRTVAVLLFWGLMAGLWIPQGAAARDVHLIMALDISGSMKHTDPLRLLPKAAHIMVGLLGEKDCLGILTFEDVTQTRLASGHLTPAQKRRGSQELARLQPRGLFTDIHQALAGALKASEPPGGAQRAVLLISDGQMDIDPLKGNSKTFVERVHQQIIPAYKKAGIPIYTVAFTPESDQALLKTLAEETGGRFLLIPAAQDLHQAFLKFFEVLKGPQLAPLVGNRFLIDPQVQEAILIVTRSQQGQPVILENPKGKKLSPASEGARWFSAPTFDMVTLPKPEPGNWTVSGHKDGDGKIILMTDLKLECPHLPEEAGADEDLLAGALLKDKDQPVTAPEVLNQTTFTADLQAEGGKPVQLQMGHPPLEQKDLWPAGARVAKFPPYNTPGQWQLRIRVLGKTFQRERNISLKVTGPWYKTQPVSRDGVSQVEFLPGPGREALELAGWLNLSAPGRGISGKFVQPPPGKGFCLALPSDLSGPFLVNAQLTGATASGRPLVLEPLPVQIDSTPGAAVPGIGPSRADAATVQGAKKFSRSRKWFWGVLGLAIIALGLLGGAAYLYRPRLLGLFQRRPAGEDIPDDISPEQHVLLLRAHVEKLQKEKGVLQADLKELREERDKLLAAKEELEARLGQPSRDYQEKSKVIKELEKRLEDAEKEAKAVQEEYMALYARSQQEKQVIKKG